MIYSSLLSVEQKRALYSIKEYFNWSDNQLDYLIACMKFESNLNTKAINKISKAKGLIQFMPSTCKALGIDHSTLEQQDFATQCKYVIKYFQPYYRKTKTLGDMYMAILMPRYIGANDNTVIFGKNTVQYAQNKGLDLNYNGEITKREAYHRVQIIYEKGLKDV